MSACEVLRTFFFFQAEDGIRDYKVTGVQTCALPIYAVFTTETGGIIDDLMVANFGDHLFLVVNAAGKAGDMAHLRTHLSDVCDVDVPEERVLVALQGPLAADALAKMSPTTVAMRFMDAGCHVVAGVPCRVSRSGYTGEA